MPGKVGTRRFIGSLVYDLLTKLLICGNKRTKALMLKAKTVPSGSRAEGMKGRSIGIKIL